MATLSARLVAVVQRIRDEFNAHKLRLVPVGGIIIWHGLASAIPSGWALCDGTNGTPDLRGRFVMGESETYARNTTGGAVSATPTISVNNHTLTEGEMPSHEHSYISQGGGPGSYPTINGPYSGYYTAYDSNPTGGGGSHGHTATSSAVATLPPYFVLAYIKKI